MPRGLAIKIQASALIRKEPLLLERREAVLNALSEMNDKHTVRH